MSLTISFIGLQHSHVFDLYRRARESERLSIVALCEPDPDAREMMKAAQVEVTHTDPDSFWSIPSDIVAVASAFGERGPLVEKALASGRHVIADKPISTRLDELGRIEAQIEESGLSLGCMLDLRDSAPFITLKSLVDAGTIGEIHAIQFGAQHPLLLGTRPAWYFEKGLHGGTIIDIGIHSVDIIRWLTGREFTRIDGARTWQATYHQTPYFHDAAQMMLTLDNQAGVLGDLSYLAPDSFGYSMPHYWRMTCWGDRGMAEASLGQPEVTVALAGERELRRVPLLPARPGGYLEAFLNEIDGEWREGDLTTRDVLIASRLALEIQHHADGSAG